MAGSVYLLLENGQLFIGKGVGATGCARGEVVFTTGMTGYLETLTDPAFYGQMVMMTFPLIGNYGINLADCESDRSHVTAFIARDFCDIPSNFRSEGTLEAFLKEKNIIGLYDIDTRQLTKIIRENGVMNALIFTEESEEAKSLQNEQSKQALLAQITSYKIENAVESVTCSATETFAPLEPEQTKDASGARIWSATKPPVTTAKRGTRVVLWDFGATNSLVTELRLRGFEVVRMSAGATAAQVLAQKPAGIVLSGGPGDPAQNGAIVAQIAELVKKTESKIPIFATGLGHQLLALSFGAKTAKMKYGHRGSNHPVKRLANGKIYVTGQNHGYTVESETLPKDAEVSFVNVNDGTCEGICYPNNNAFSVQFSPDGNSSPLDTGFLFDDFIARIQTAQK